MNDEIKEHIKTSVSKLKNTLLEFADSTSSHTKKRAKLLSYWISSYSDYIKNEDSFDPMNLIKYKQKSIVQVNFGYRIGRELGGLHYAVVIDYKNSKRSDLITVVPLMSLKPDFKENHQKIKLDIGVYDLVYMKYSEKLFSLGNQLNQLILDHASEPEEVNKAADKLRKEIKSINSKLELMKNLKEGTIADTGQIITVSKQRIYNPKKANDLLFGIYIDDSDFDNIKRKIKLNYFE